MTTNKPPMTLYFRENISNVHMEQFMEQVERRAVKLFCKSFHNTTLSACVSKSLNELATEIMEGKA